MKRFIILSLTILSMTFSLVGCKVNNGEYNTKKTLFGYSILHDELTYLSQKEVGAMFALNALIQYNNTTNKEFQEAIINFWFYGKRIEGGNGKYFVMDRDGVYFSVICKDVIPEGALWAYEIVRHNQFMFDKNEFIITAYSDGTYKCSIKNRGEINYKKTSDELSTFLELNTTNYKSLITNPSSELTLNNLSFHASASSYNSVKILPVTGNATLVYAGQSDPQYLVEGDFSSTIDFVNINIKYRGVTENYTSWVYYY